MKELASFERAKKKGKSSKRSKVSQEEDAQARLETMVSKAVSRAESLLSLSREGIGQKIEELIEEKSRSIVNVITQS